MDFAELRATLQLRTVLLGSSLSGMAATEERPLVLSKHAPMDEGVGKNASAKTRGAMPYLCPVVARARRSEVSAVRYC